MRWNRTTARRALGAATTAYGATLLARPSALTSPARLPNTTGYRRFARLVGLRDTLSGIALIASAAQHGPAVNRSKTSSLGKRAETSPAAWAVRARVLADAADVVIFGVLCPPSAKLKAAGIAGGYGLLGALTHPRHS